MKSLTLGELNAQSALFDQAVEGTPGIDVFCSSLDWGLPAHGAFGASREPWLWQGESAFAAFMKGHHHDGFRYLAPLEGMWLLGSPFVVWDPVRLVEEATELFKGHHDWDVALLAGMDHQQLWVERLLYRLSQDFRIYRGPLTIRVACSLEGGLEGFLAGRSRYFRRNLRRDISRCSQEKIEFNRIAIGSLQEAELYFERIMNIEASSWKGLSESGVNQGEMREFYRLMMPRLVRRGGARLIVASRDGEDLGFIFGGVSGQTYRGLQFSFKDSLSHLGLGNVLQYQAISQLSEEGITRYDLGTDIEYKRRWGEPYLTTTMFTMARI